MYPGKSVRLTLSCAGCGGAIGLPARAIFVSVRRRHIDGNGYLLVGGSIEPSVR